jgi:type VI protein secretion system component VasA
MSAAERVLSPLAPTYLGPKPSTTTAPAAPKSRREQLLERRARLLERAGSRSSRTDELLARRAKLLRGR